MFLQFIFTPVVEIYAWFPMLEPHHNLYCISSLTLNIVWLCYTHIKSKIFVYNYV